MNAPWVSAFTVIEMDDWALLFIGERLAAQGHSIRLRDLKDLAGNTPFTLSLVEAHGTKLEKSLTENGQWDEQMPLHKAVVLTKDKK